MIDELHLFFLAGNLYLYRDRKLLGREIGKESNRGKSEGEGGRTTKNAEFNTVKIGMVGGPGIFALCCVSLCPCFFRKRRPTGHTVLPKDVDSCKFIKHFQWKIFRNSICAMSLKWRKLDLSYVLIVCAVYLVSYLY